ncbi:MAG: LuxR C-terminal-related transcriptional regulator [Planctomycetota bacterium]|nr:LuxR C-terminal-related transcriptional regulator [Planctomycetota bacterium]
MKTTMHPVSRTANLIHILEDNSLQKSLIAKMLTADKMQTAGHDSWEEFHYAYSPDESACLVANYNLLHPATLDQIAESANLSNSLSSNFSEPNETDISLIFYADRPSAHDVVRGIRSGAVDFLEKPLSAQSLVDSVRHGIRKSQEVRQKKSERDGLRKRAAQLTRRERETMALVLKGLSIKQIASAFGIGLQTAAKHRARLLNKMEVTSDAQLVQLLYSRREMRA